MIKVSSDTDRVLVAKIKEAAQDQVLAFWDELVPEGQKALLAQLRALDLQSIRKLIAQYLQGNQEVLEARMLTAAPLETLGIRDPVSGADALAAGEEALRKGSVGILTAAGDMGGCPGLDQPKGLCPIGPVSGKSLFRLHAEKIRATSNRFRTAIPWIISTSPTNCGQIQAHFKEADYFGLNRADVTFIVQEELPVVNFRGKILLAEPGRLAMSANGHGGVILRLLADDVFGALEVRGLEHLFYFQVDNPMVRIADQAFIGHHILRSCELSSKAIRKIDPDEKVGVFCGFNGGLGVVEHRELGEADRSRRSQDGGLEFSAANIGVHLFSLGFLRRLREEGLDLSYHFAQKKTAYVDRKGVRVVPRQPNSIQFECFIFDTIPKARSSMVLETARQEEFSPVKNATGQDSLITARKDISRLHLQWLREAGAQTAPGQDPEPDPVEISPLYALDLQELKAKIAPGLVIRPGLYLE